MKNVTRVKITKESSEKFYESLTDQEKKVVDKMTNNAMKPYFETQANLQKSLQSNMVKFLQQNKRV